MGATDDCPGVRLKPGDRVCGFRIERVEAVAEIRATAIEAVHEKTGALFLHLYCGDRENLFSVGFRTPPGDSTGVAHILEHSVLAGSETYPVKDAFNELSRSTLQTFINAFTYPDKTLYPVASQVKTDFFNLARVYTDLVFRPRIARETFAQEGHHLTFEDPENTASDLSVSGIVFNEMKGAYSSPDNLMYKAIQEGLYPDTPYAFDSGGDPEAIPALTYDQLRGFHRLYYSPSNARFFLYGDIPTEDHLAFLEGALEGFGRVAVDSSVAAQGRWEAPRRMRRPFPIGKDEDPAGKAALNMAWLMMENRDHEEAVLLQVVAHALIGTAAGPLRKALIDSGIGEDLSPVSGLELDLRQISFAVGLRGCDAASAERFESLVMETLESLAAGGLDRDLVEAALHQVEFHGREIVRGAYPYSISLMSRVYHTWLYEGEPLAGLRFNRVIEGVRRRWAADPQLFQGFMKKWFLDNPHRLLSVMEPSLTFQEDQQRRFREKMAALKAGLRAEELEKIRAEAAALHRLQVEPDEPAALATLPRLRLSDIPRDIERIPLEKTAVSGIPTLRHEIYANGIAYLDLAFDIADIPPDLQALLPFAGRLTTGMGAAGLTYDEMARKISLRTGGVGCSLMAGLTRDGDRHWQKAVFRVRALHRNIPEALAVLFDLLTEGDLTDEGRMRDLLFEMRNRLQASIVPSGHLFAQRTAAAALSLPAALDEKWHGRGQLLFLSSSADAFQDRKAGLAERVRDLRDRVFRKSRLTINLTADAEGLAAMERSLEDLLPRLGDVHRGGASTPFQGRPVAAGVAIPAQVCYVARVLRAPAYSDPLAPALTVLSRELSKGFLYKKIRVQGGAYGAMCMFDPLNGIFSFLSYRDPNLSETLRAYEEALDLAARQDVDGEDLEKTLIGTIGALDRPMDPAGKGFTSMVREFSGISDEDRLRFRQGVLAVSAASLREAAVSRLLPSAPSASIAVYAADERLHRANEALQPALEIEPLLGKGKPSAA